MRHFVPADVAQRHMISVVDEKQVQLAATVTTLPGQGSRRAPIVSDAPLTPALNGLLLRGQGWRTSIGLISNTLFWMVLALSVLTVWMLLGTWRHMRRRAQIQGALVQETNFRRAMENSMPTGMRAMDLDGRITYVNAAFCQMTGFTQGELVGRLPPYPYWPPDRIEENSRLLQQELQGRSPSGGIEVKVMRKDGTLFDARMYVSPLIDPKGQQTGLDDQHDQHHRGQAHPRPALGQPRALHHRARGAGRRGVGAFGAAGRTAVRQPLLPAVVRRRRARPPADGRRAWSALPEPTPKTTSTPCRACRRRRSPSPAPTRARSSSSRCRSGSTCARATCSGPTAGWRRC